MSLKHSKKPTDHSMQRLLERTHFTSAKTLKRVSKIGIPIERFRNYPKLYNWLCSISPYKRVKVYEGYVFIYNLRSDRCITLYPIKDEYLEDYKDYMSKFGGIN